MGSTFTLRRMLRGGLPWWVKCALKLGAAKVPLNYATLRKFGLARHGKMDRPEWAMAVFDQHFNSADFNRKSGGFTCLELGPGDSLFSAVIARARGASQTHLIDVGGFASRDVRLYQRMADHLRTRGLPAPDLSAAASLEDVLHACGGTYLTGGLDSLREIPAASIDLIFSNSVLQHVRLPHLADTLAQLRRIIHPQGCAMHALDLRDMMGQSLNHLRFPRRIWESDWFQQAEFYTSRLLLSEWIDAFERAHFSAELTEDNRWEQLPVSPCQMARPFRDLPDAMLRSKTVRVLTRPKLPG